MNNQSILRLAYFRHNMSCLFSVMAMILAVTVDAHCIKDQVGPADLVYIDKKKTFIIAGPMCKWDTLNKTKVVTEYAINRIRVGDFRWFPKLTVLDEFLKSPVPEIDANEDVFIRGYHGEVRVPSSVIMPIESFGTIVAEQIVPVTNREEEILTFVQIPKMLLRDEAVTIHFDVTNPLLYDLKETQIIVDLEGFLQFEDGKPEQYTTHNKKYDEPFMAVETKRVSLSLVPAQLVRQHRQKNMSISVMVLGYREQANDTLVLIYAFWTKKWRVE